MSWERAAGSDDLWKKSDDDSAWFYVREEDEVYTKATLDPVINAAVIGDFVSCGLHVPTIITGQATMQGVRSTQEDRVWAQDCDFLPYCAVNTAHIMVADGHVGDCAAEFAVRRLPVEVRQRFQAALSSDICIQHRIKTEPKLASAVADSTDSFEAQKGEGEIAVENEAPINSRKRERVESGEGAEGPKIKCRREEVGGGSPTGLSSTTSTQAVLSSLREALASSYQELDADFLRLNKTSKAGSTCSSVTLLGNMVVAGNIGDSRMLLVKHPTAGLGEDGGAPAPVTSRLSAEHKPGNLDEKARIEKVGGVVRRMGGCWRVVPDLVPGVRTAVALAVSRSFGDRVLKKYVISKPHIATLVLNAEEDAAIILATDGVWDTIADQMAGNLVYGFYNSRDAESAARALIRAAFQRGSEDNITCAVIFIYPKSGCCGDEISPDEQETPSC